VMEFRSYCTYTLKVRSAWHVPGVMGSNLFTFRHRGFHRLFLLSYFSTFVHDNSILALEVEGTVFYET